jgi:hypothetical protein
MKKVIVIVLLAFSVASCGVYSFSGGSVGDAKTISVAFFPNKSTLVNPTLSQTFTEKLKDKFQRQSRLAFVNESGDFDLSGYISSYYVQPVAIQGNNQAKLNRLTISVHVLFVNRTDPKLNFERDFEQYSDFDVAKTLNQVEAQLIPDISDKLTQDIFAATVMNW